MIIMWIFDIKTRVHIRVLNPIWFHIHCSECRKFCSRSLLCCLVWTPPRCTLCIASIVLGLSGLMFLSHGLLASIGPPAMTFSCSAIALLGLSKCHSLSLSVRLFLSCQSALASTSGSPWSNYLSSAGSTLLLVSTYLFQLAWCSQLPSAISEFIFLPFLSSQ